MENNNKTLTKSFEMERRNKTKRKKQHCRYKDRVQTRVEPLYYSHGF